MKIRITSLITFGFGLFAGIASLSANAVSFDFTTMWGSDTPLNVSMNTFISGGQSLTAKGYYTSGSAQNLFGKHQGAGEQGLGLVADAADHEIESIDFIRLDLTSLMSAGYHSFEITLGSLQPGEGGTFYFTANGSGLLGGTYGNQLLGGALTQSWSFNDTTFPYHFVDITGSGISGGDVILAKVTATSVPENGTTGLLLGGALFGFAIIRRRFLR